MAKKLIKDGHYHRLVSWTTRPKRVGEVEGRDYHFTDAGSFLDAVAKGGFVEYSNFNGWLYGTPHSEIEQEVNIGVFNTKGVASLSRFKDKYDIAVIYIDCPWPIRLFRSIKREKKFSFEMVRRLFADKKDFAHHWVEVMTTPGGIPFIVLRHKDFSSGKAVQKASSFINDLIDSVKTELTC